MNRPVGCLLLHGASLVPDGGVSGIWVLGRSPLGAGCGAFSHGGGVQSVSSPPCSADSLRSKLFVRAQRERGTSRALLAARRTGCSRRRVFPRERDVFSLLLTRWKWQDKL